MKYLFQTKCPITAIVLIAYAVTLLPGCNQQSYNNPEGYDLANPSKMQLGKVLNEISGLSFNTDNNTLLAISDSKEKVFELNIERRKLKDYTDRVVSAHSDLEDIVKVDSTLYLLGSRGVIYEVPSRKHSDSSGTKAHPFSSNLKNDFETLYYDPGVNGLIMICKSCAFDEEAGVHSAFKFDLATKTFDTSAFYTLNDKEVHKVLKDDDAKFRPSAAAIHPINKRLYVLSSAGNLLIVTDIHGQVIEAYNLRPDDFPQAEGIAFAPNGDLFISNEGKYGSMATLLFFPYRTGNKK